MTGAVPAGLAGSLGKEPGGAFYLHGADDFRKEEAARALVAAHLDPATRDFNLDRLRGSEVDVETLASVLGTPPMMAEWRVVVLRETEALASSRRARDVLLGAVRSPPPGLALVILCTVPDRSSARFYRDLAKLARSAEFAPVGLDDLPGWLMARAREVHGRELLADAARAVAAGGGGDLAVLVRELEKLDAVAPEGQAITLAEVEAAGTPVPRQDRWAWFDLVGSRKTGAALDGLRALLAHGESAVGLTIGLATHMLRLGIATEGGRRRLAGSLPPHQKWLADRFVRQSREWSTGEVEEALEGLLRVDRLLKSSPLPPEHHLELWLLASVVREPGRKMTAGGSEGVSKGSVPR